MSAALPLSRLVRAWSLLLLCVSSCASPPGYTPRGGTRQAQGPAPQPSAPVSTVPQAPGAPGQEGEGGSSPPAELAYGSRALADGRLHLFPPPPPYNPSLDTLSPEDIRPFLAAFNSLAPPSRVRLHLLEVPGATGVGRGPAEPWEARLRDEFISRFGPPLLPLPESLATSRLFLALQLAPLYMHEGIRQAAIELFSSRAFILGVCLSIVVYMAAWLAPEPVFTKAFAAALTFRLTLVAGIMEVGQLALAFLRLYQEAEAARTPQELEAASKRFAYSMSGAWLRVTVTLVTLGFAKFIPTVPEGGIWRLLPAVSEEGALVAQSVSSAQVLADGSLIVSGVSASSAACATLAWCAANSSGGGASKLSTRYGPPHTRKNPPHNEAIEKELAAREAAGHASLRKNKAQVDKANQPVKDNNPVNGVRFRRPDASSVRPDGVRHNVNFVSNPKDMQRELDAFEAMRRADPKAIHELYLLDGTLVRRHVPQGVNYP